MYKVFFILCILLGPLCTAEADVLAVADVPPAWPTHTILAGIIKSVSIANPAIGTTSEVAVLDPSKKFIKILITSTTTLWDQESKAIMLDKIAVKSRVKVIYITSSEGVNIGKSIKILK